MAQKYGKVLTLKTNDGDKQITDAAKATAILKRLDNDARLFAITNEDGSRDYYNLGLTSCVFCIVASYTSNATEVADTPCEDALPATCTSIALDKDAATVGEGATVKLTATTVPAGADVTFTSNNAAVATVAEDGTVTGVAAGTAVITATLAACGSEASATATITVTA